MNLIKNSCKSLTVFPQSFIYGFLATTVSGILFFVLSNMTQVTQIVSLHISLTSKFSILVTLFAEVVRVLSLPMVFLVGIYFVLLYCVYTTMIAIFLYKRKQARFNKNYMYEKGGLEHTTFKQKIFIAISFALSFLGFGCVACGQAILLSLLSVFVTNLTLGVAYAFSYLILIIGIILLMYALYKNMKVLNNPNVCPL